MSDTLIEPDVESALIAYAAAQYTAHSITGVTVSARVEDGKHVRVVATGGRGDHAKVMFAQQVTVECFGGTLAGSSLLMRQFTAFLRDIQNTVYGGVTFYELATLGAGMNAVDPVTKRARYTRTFVIDVRLLVL